MSPLFRLHSYDFAKGAVVAVLAALAVYFAQVLNSPGFDFTQIDWNYVVKTAIAALVGYLGKNFITDSTGKVGGVL